MTNILTWDLYEITTQQSSIQGVMLRGRIRKFALQHGITLLTENASDRENTVRFALLSDESPDQVIAFVETIIPDAHIGLVQTKLANPVLSKMKVNKEERYTI